MKSKCCGAEVTEVGDSYHCKECGQYLTQYMVHRDLQPEPAKDFNRTDSIKISGPEFQPTEHAGRWPIHLAEHHKNQKGLKPLTAVPITVDEIAEAGDYMRQLEAELAARDNEIAMRAKLFHEDMERLKAERDEAWEQYSKRECKFDELFDEAWEIRKERDALKAENERLKAQNEGLEEACDAFSEELAATVQLKQECEQLRAREVELVAYTFPYNYKLEFGKYREVTDYDRDDAKRLIAEYEESKNDTAK